MFYSLKSFLYTCTITSSLVLIPVNSHADTINSKAYAVFDISNNKLIDCKNEKQRLPIASITKLMTAMVTLDNNPDLEEIITITQDDVDTLLHTTSRLSVGTQLTRREALNLALMSSENRAASALARHYPGGKKAFIRAMNTKARKIQMKSAQFFDSTGLDARNQATAKDLIQLVNHSKNYSLIHMFTTTDAKDFTFNNKDLHYVNTNPLIRLNNPNWNIELSKTGYTQKAGKCIVLLSEINGKKYIISLLGSKSKESRLQDLATLKEKIKDS